MRRSIERIKTCQFLLSLQLSWNMRCDLFHLQLGSLGTQKKRIQGDNRNKQFNTWTCLHIACSKRILQFPHTKCQILCLFVNFNNLHNRTVISQFFSKIIKLCKVTEWIITIAPFVQLTKHTQSTACLYNYSFLPSTQTNTFYKSPHLRRTCTDMLRDTKEHGASARLTALDILTSPIGHIRNTCRQMLDVFPSVFLFLLFYCLWTKWVTQMREAEKYRM